MHLEPTQDQRALRDSVRTVLARECPPALARAAVEKGAPATALWQRVVQLGWVALALPETAGGLGLGPVEVSVVAEELGRCLAPVPWLATVSHYAAVVAAAGIEAQVSDLLSAVAEGRTGSLAVREDDTSPVPALFATTANRVAGGWRLSGTKTTVVDGATADDLVVVAAVDGRLAGFVVARADTTVTQVRTVDATRGWADVRLVDVRVPDARALGEPGSAETDAAIRRGLEHAVAALAAETVGVCRGLLDATVAYACVRHQFGVPIGSFQAVKHRLADAHLALERARACAIYAALCLAEDAPDRSLAVEAAAVAAGDAATRVARDALQTHGGIGYTWECDLHLWIKRARANAVVLGTPAWHRQRVADLLGLPA